MSSRALVNLTPATDLLIRTYARLAWVDANHETRAVIRFGMVPLLLMNQLRCSVAPLQIDQDGGRAFTAELFRCAAADGGMKA